MDPRTDAELVLAARAGDTKAFEQLVERHAPLARRVAARMVANREVAWELAQEALLQAYLSLDNLRQPARFPSWLYGIVRNVCRSYLRSQKVDLCGLDSLGRAGAARWLADERLDPQAHAEARELYTLVERAVAGLSPKNRAAVRLFYYEQLSVREIAAQLNVSVNAVKGRLFQARAQLRDQLAPVVASYRWRAGVEHAPSDERRTNMSEISSIHVIKTPLDYRILYLLDTANQRVLVMWIGAHEAEQIDMHLRGDRPVRPMTYQFTASLLQALGAELAEVCVSGLEKTTFYATVTVRQGEAVHELDARPSDAIATALHMGCPIFVADAVMEQAGSDLPQPFDESAWLAQKTQAMAELYRSFEQLMESTEQEEETFTWLARGVMQRLPAEARGLNHHYIGTEHLLLSLAREEGIAARVLSELGVRLNDVEESLLRLVGRGAQPPTGDPVVAPRVVQVLNLAQDEQQARGHSHIGTEHLLLGILREGNGMAIAILRDLGVDPAQVRTKTLEQIGAE